MPANKQVCGFVIYDTKTKCYYNGRTMDEPDLQKVRARFERVQGAQLEVNRQQSGGYKDCENLVILPITMVALPTPIIPKVAKQKRGFVIQITEHVPAVKMWKQSAYDRVQFYKGNKAKLPLTVAQIRTQLDAYAETRGFCNRNEQWVKDERQQNALRSAHYNWSGHSNRVATKVRATVFPSREAAQRQWDVHKANLDQYYRDYKAQPCDQHRDLKTERARFTIEIVEVK